MLFKEITGRNNFDAYSSRAAPPRSKAGLYLLLLKVDLSPVWPFLTPELPAVGLAAAIKTVPEEAILAQHVAVLTPDQELIGGHICCDAKQLTQYEKDVADEKWQLHTRGSIDSASIDLMASRRYHEDSNCRLGPQMPSATIEP